MAKPISFARGAPSLDIVDVEGLKEAAQRAFANDPARVTAYGTSIGYPPLREWIAEHHQVDPRQVIVTNGSMQADAFLFDALVEPHDAVIVERPTYDRTLLSLRNRGADVRRDGDGLSERRRRRIRDDDERRVIGDPREARRGIDQLRNRDVLQRHGVAQRRRRVDGTRADRDRQGHRPGHRSDRRAH